MEGRRGRRRRHQHPESVGLCGGLSMVCLYLCTGLLVVGVLTMGILMFPLLVALKVDGKLKWGWVGVFMPLFAYTVSALLRKVRVDGIVDRRLTLLHAGANLGLLAAEIGVVLRLTSAPSSALALTVVAPLAVWAAMNSWYTVESIGEWNLVSRTWVVNFSMVTLSAALVAVKLDGKVSGLAWPVVTLPLLVVPVTALLAFVKWRYVAHAVFFELIALGRNHASRSVTHASVLLLERSAPGCLVVLAVLIVEALLTWGATVITVTAKLSHGSHMTMRMAFIPLWIGVPIWVITACLWAIMVMYAVYMMENAINRAALVEAQAPTLSEADLESVAPSTGFVADALNFGADAQGKVMCVICLCDLEDGEDVRHLPCRHIFHADCIQEWVQRKAECPTCRSGLAPTSAASAASSAYDDDDDETSATATGASSVDSDLIPDEHNLRSVDNEPPSPLIPLLT